MCLSGFSKSQLKHHRESAAEEFFLVSIECSSQEFSSFWTQCVSDTLDAPADFTILLLRSKCEHTPHTWTLSTILENDRKEQKSK
jgi:hypothetical protein